MVARRKKAGRRPAERGSVVDWRVRSKRGWCWPPLFLPANRVHSEQQAATIELNRRSFWRFASKCGMTSRQLNLQLRAQLQKLVDSCDLYIRVNEDVLLMVLRDGRFKSQFETKTSRGAYDPEGRARAEQRIMGVDPQCNVRMRPIYGYLCPRGYDNTRSHRYVSSYGSVIVRLRRDSLCNRTTFTLGDSLSCDGVVLPLQLDRASHGGGLMSAAVTCINRLHPSPSGPAVFAHVDIDSLVSEFMYLEAQYHGGLSVHDIRDMLIPSEITASAAVREQLLQGLTAAGIAFTFRKG